MVLILSINYIFLYYFIILFIIIHVETKSDEKLELIEQAIKCGLLKIIALKSRLIEDPLLFV